jgi:hypothetical protein
LLYCTKNKIRIGNSRGDLQPDESKIEMKENYLTQKEAMKIRKDKQEQLIIKLALENTKSY